MSAVDPARDARMSALAQAWDERAVEFGASKECTDEEFRRALILALKGDGGRIVRERATAIQRSQRNGLRLVHSRG